MNNHSKEDLLINLYQEYFSKIYNYIYYQVNHADVCDELVSSVFLKVVEHIDSYDSKKAAVSTWIYTIARNTIIDYFRQRKQEENVEDYVNYIECALSFEDACRKYVEENNGYIGDLLAVLNEKELNVIRLRYFEGYSNKDAAERLGLNPSTVRTIHERALKKMLVQLQKNNLTFLDVY